MQYSIVETFGSKNSVKVGFSGSDNFDYLAIQQNNNMARISTFEGVDEENPNQKLNFD